MPDKETKRPLKYGKFTLTDTGNQSANATAETDVVSPTLDQLQAKAKGKTVSVDKLKGEVTFKRAVPKSKTLDGSSSSKRVLIKNGRVLGAQG